MQRRTRSLAGTGLWVLSGLLITGSAPGVGSPQGSAAAGASQPIPERPELLEFPRMEFELPDASRHRRELSNGLPVYVFEDHAVPLFNVTLALPVGDFLDPSSRIGLASLTASMLRRGGAGERDADAFDREAAFLGIQINSLGGSRRSGLVVSGSPRVLEPALDLFADVLLRPRFQEDRVAHALANLSASLGKRNDSPLAVLDREWRWALWGRQHYRARKVLPKHIEGLGPEALADFHRRAWTPRGAVLAVSGDFDGDRVLELLEERLGGWRAPEDATRPAAESTAARPADPGLLVVERELPQVKIQLGHQGLQRADWDQRDAWALIMLSEVLDGQGAVSRLRSRLRARDALVYRIAGSFGIGSVEPGLFEVFLETEPVDAVSALGAVLEEIERLRTEPVPIRELELARKIVIDSFPLLFETASEVAGRFAEDELLGRPHSYWQLYPRRLREVTPADVQRVARKYLLPDQLRVVWVGPRPSATQVEALGLPGGIRVLDELDPLTLEPRADRVSASEDGAGLGPGGGDF